MNPNKLHFCLFMASLDRCNRSCNTLDESPDRICVPNKAEDLNLIIFDMITRINEEKALTKHISWNSKCKFHGQKCNYVQKWNKDMCRCKYKNSVKHRVCEKDYVWNLDRCACEINCFMANVPII